MSNKDNKTTVERKPANSKDVPAAGVLTEAELRAELARLRDENAALKTRNAGPVTLKVSELGAVSIYGLGRFPVTLYKEQWLKLLGMAGDINAFIKANESRLSAGKDDPKFMEVKARRAAEAAAKAGEKPASSLVV